LLLPDKGDFRCRVKKRRDHHERDKPSHLPKVIRDASNRVSKSKSMAWVRISGTNAPSPRIGWIASTVMPGITKTKMLGLKVGHSAK